MPRLEVIERVECFTGFRNVTRSLARCTCGEEILLIDPLDNVCSNCGTIYNMSGQESLCLSRDVDPLDAGEVYEDRDDQDDLFFPEY